jgi:hypothetical protein
MPIQIVKLRSKEKWLPIWISMVVHATQSGNVEKQFGGRKNMFKGELLKCI